MTTNNIPLAWEIDRVPTSTVPLDAGEEARDGPPPFRRTLEQFDFGFQPSIDERLVKELANLAFVAEATNVLLCQGRSKNVPLGRG